MLERKRHLKRIAAFLREFAELLEEIPEDSRETVRKQFCVAMGDYFKAMERGNE